MRPHFHILIGVVLLTGFTREMSAQHRTLASFNGARSKWALSSVYTSPQ